MKDIEKINMYLLSEVAKLKSLTQGSFGLDSHILYDLYFDSVDLMDLLMAIENDLHIVIQDEDLETFTTLRSISNTIVHYTH
ncbi:acyl carrier protein [Lelliottia sp. WAP21]|uniref:acyl carrier protein n=1 Tax=Lelliottia sp. WAP21 TaxID=2877426 RepID=UPI001E6501DB|nr:acyl carrier protein [Lelliottia sp. WAP21]